MFSEQRHRYEETRCKIIAIDRIREDTIELTFYAPAITEIARPGQFVMIDAEHFFLRRPMSIFNVNDKDLHILMKIEGKGTEALSKLRPGNIVKMLGPLGNGFPIPDKSLKPIIVAGGMGFAPMYFIYTRLVSSGFWPVFFYGENKAEDTSLANLIPTGAKIATMDGRAGFAGYVTDAVDTYLSHNGSENVIIYSCGPEPMYRAMSKLPSFHKLPILISLEERMACGIGACLGCSVETRSGYKRVCRDGPVFFLNEMNYE